MSRIKELLILEHFTKNQFDKPYTFGKYWFEFENYGKALVIRQNDEWKVVSNYIGEPIKHCLSDIKEEIVDELKLEIEKQINS